MTSRRSVLCTTVLVGLVAAGAALGTSAPVGAAERPSTLSHWEAAAADAPARTEAAREAVDAAVEGGARGAAAVYDAVRIAGVNRYATSVAATKALYPEEVLATNPLGVVFVASASDYPDALAATAFAKPFGPLLLVPPSGTVPAVVMTELRRLQPEFVVVVGGTGAVSEGVRTQLATVAETDRVAGADRFSTAAQVATITDETYEEQEPELPLGVTTVLVVVGDDFPDALAAGAATGAFRGAVVLTRTSGLPAVSSQAISAIGPDRAIVVGGPGTVSENVMAQLRALLPGKEVVRLSGADRFATAAALSAGAWIHPGSGVLLANGQAFPDALTAAGFGAVVEYPLLLSRTSCAPRPTVLEAEDYADYLTVPLQVVGFGGTAVLSDEALTLTPC